MNHKNGSKWYRNTKGQIISVSHMNIYEDVFTQLTERPAQTIMRMGLGLFTVEIVTIVILIKLGVI